MPEDIDAGGSLDIERFGFDVGARRGILLQPDGDPCPLA